MPKYFYDLPDEHPDFYPQLIRSFGGKPVTYNQEFCDRTVESNEIPGRIYFNLSESVLHKVKAGAARIVLCTQQGPSAPDGRDLQLDSIEIKDVN